MRRNATYWDNAAVAVIVFALTAMFPGSAIGAEKVQTPDEMNGLPLVFEENFESGRDNWVATDEKAWEIKEEEGGDHVFALVRSSEYKPPVRSPRSIARIKGLEVSDFVLEAQMKQTGREYGHRDLCIFFGYQDPANFYYVHIATNADAHANSIFIVDDKPRTSIATKRNDGTDWGKGYHRVRIERDTESGKIEVFFDDMENPIMTAEDKTFIKGGIGFGSFDDVGCIDDIRIWGKK